MTNDGYDLFIPEHMLAFTSFPRVQLWEEVATGVQVYRVRIGGSSYTSSPVPADGRIYFVAENGQVRIVKAGANFELLAENEIEDICMTVPALSGGLTLCESKELNYHATDQAWVLAGWNLVLWNRGSGYLQVWLVTNAIDLIGF